MKYLFLMGGSGSGKTVLAMNLEKNAPEVYHRVLEVTTRAIRDNETAGVDYEFLSDEEYVKIEKDLIESVKYQFLPAKYGAKDTELQDKKWNIIVASIEGFLSGLKQMQPGDIAVLINILIDTNLDIQRDGRTPMTEQNFNLGVINNLLDESRSQIIINGKTSFYYELPLSKLKEIRNIPIKYITFFNETISSLVKETLKTKLKNTEDYNELISIFMNNSTSISESNLLLDILEVQTKKFGKTVEELCNDSLAILRNWTS